MSCCGQVDPCRLWASVLLTGSLCPPHPVPYDDRYRRSYDSEFAAPLVLYHVWPALMEADVILVKGEAVTRRGALVRTQTHTHTHTRSLYMTMPPWYTQILPHTLSLYFVMCTILIGFFWVAMVTLSSSGGTEAAAAALCAPVPSVRHEQWWVTVQGHTHWPAPGFQWFSTGRFYPKRLPVNPVPQRYGIRASCSKMPTGCGSWGLNPVPIGLWSNILETIMHYQILYCIGSCYPLCYWGEMRKRFAIECSACFSGIGYYINTGTLN